MDEIPRGIAISIENAGWKPGKRIAEGGGGTVFACFPKSYIDIYESVMNHVRTQVQSFSSGTTAFAVEIGNQLISDNMYRAPFVGAVKIPHAVQSDKIDKRLSDEIEAMASFDHPNMIRLLSRDTGRPPRWFIMEFYAKGTLHQNADCFLGKPLLALEALRPIVEGVSLLHSHKIVHVHRDIKPKNIFVSNDGQLVLGDFGIVFTKEDDRTRLTEPGDAPYSRDWIPEWVRHRSPEDFSTKVDVYMLAKVLYFMLANKNVLPSQLDDEDFDLKQMFPSTVGIDLVYDLLTHCIAPKEKGCQLTNAGELLAEMDEVIAMIQGTSSCLLFNFLSTHSVTNLALPKKQGQDIKSLTDIQVYLPARGRKFIAKARVLGTEDLSAAEIGFSLGNEKSETIRVGASTNSQGSWSEEIHLQTSKPLERGWHSLKVDGYFVDKQSILTGFMLYSV